MFRQRARRCGLRLEPQHPPGLSHYVTNIGPQEQMLLSYWQRETEPRSKAVLFPRNSAS